METKRSFDTAVVVSITSGVLLCEFSEVHQCVEFLAGGPVWTHQMADKPFVDAVKAGVLAQHPELKKVNASGVNRENWEAFAVKMRATFGPRLYLVPLDIGAEIKAKSFTEPLKGKKFIGVVTE